MFQELGLLFDPLSLILRRADRLGECPVRRTPDDGARGLCGHPGTAFGQTGPKPGQTIE